MKAKVMHLTSVHACNDSRIFRKECVSLAEAGYDVVLAAPGEADGEDRNVRLVAIPPARGRLRRMTLSPLRVWRAAVREEADLYHFHDPELIPVGLLLKLSGKRVVYDVHEDVPGDILTKEWIPRPLRTIVSRAVGIVQIAAAHVFDGVVAVTPGDGRRFPQHKTVAVENFPIFNELTVSDPSPVAKRPALVAYVGGITRPRGIRELVSAMGRLPESLGARLALAGRFMSPGLEDELRRTDGWARVDFLGWRGRPEVARLLAEARLGVVTFLPAPNHVQVRSHKLFEYMSAGLPVVASDFPLWRRFVEDAGCGLLVDSRDPRAIAEAIHWLLEHPAQAEQMGRRGQSAVRERFNWQQQSEILLDFYDRLLNKGRGAVLRTTPMRQRHDRPQPAERAA